MGEFSLMFCTTGSRDEAERIAAALVENRLAACVQIVPIESVYRWDGALRHDAELLLSIKTLASRAKEVEACIKRLHSYGVPEITMVDVTGGSSEYLAWVKESASRR